jgi:AcrR family transcriptional regulator
MPDAPEPAATRDRILIAARTVIRSAGSYPWSMASVAEHAAVSRRTLYRHFPGKADLIDAVTSGPTSSPTTHRTDPPPAGTPRAGTATGRRLLLTAARERFGAKGFEATSVREIADQAGVTKLMVYRHFGSKARLFQAATMDPIKGFIAEFTARWAARPRGQRPIVEDVRDFYAALCDVLEVQRDLLAPLLFAGSARHGTETLDNNQYLAQVFRQWFELMDRIMLAETTDQRFRGFDQHLASRLIFGMILSVVLHKDWLLPAHEPERTRLITEMANLTVFGILDATSATIQPLVADGRPDETGST